MKKHIFLISFVGALLCCVYTAESRIFICDKVYIEQPAYEEILAIADEICIQNTLKKEFIGIGRKIIANTEIEQYFIAVAMRVNFSGKANKGLILIGNNIKADGTIEDNLTAFGKNIQMDTYMLKGNLKASAENIEIKGNIGGKTILWGKDIFISGTYNDIVIYGNNIVFGQDTIINGDLTYNTPVKKDLSALTVKGNIVWNKPFTERIKGKAPLAKFKKLYLFFSLLFPVLTMLGFFPNLFKHTTYLSGHKFLKCFISGLLLIIPTLIAIPIIFITIIGAPLGLIVTSFFLSLIYVSRVFPAIFIGRSLLFKIKDTTLVWVISTFIGIFLFTTISLHPTAKILLNLISIPTGFGALFMGRINFIKRLRKEGVL